MVAALLLVGGSRLLWADGLGFGLILQLCFVFREGVLFTSFPSITILHVHQEVDIEPVVWPNRAPKPKIMVHFKRDQMPMGPREL